MSKEIKHIPVSQIAHSIDNNGRLATKLLSYDPDLAQSIFQANHTDMEPLVVVAIEDDKEATACLGRTQELLDALDLGEKGKTVDVSVEDGDDATSVVKHAITADNLSIPVDSKINFRAEAGHRRLLHFYLKWLTTGEDDLLACRVTDAKTGKDLSRVENMIKQVGVQAVSDQDIYAITYAMLEDGTIRREVDLRNKTGLKRTRAQKIFGLAVKGHMFPKFDKQIREDKIQIGDKAVTLKSLPNGIGSKIKACKNFKQIQECLVENVKPSEKAPKTMSGSTIKDELMDRACEEVQALLEAICNNEAGDAIEAIMKLNEAFLED